MLKQEFGDFWTRLQVGQEMKLLTSNDLFLSWWAYFFPIWFTDATGIFWAYKCLMRVFFFLLLKIWKKTQRCSFPRRIKPPQPNLCLLHCFFKKLPEQFPANIKEPVSKSEGFCDRIKQIYGGQKQEILPESDKSICNSYSIFVDTS